MNERRQSDSEGCLSILLRAPLVRFGEPDDVGYAVLYQISDESRFVAGSGFVVDGGWLAQCEPPEGLCKSDVVAPRYGQRGAATVDVPLLAEIQYPLGHRRLLGIGLILRLQEGGRLGAIGNHGVAIRPCWRDYKILVTACRIRAPPPEWIGKLTECPLSEVELDQII